MAKWANRERKAEGDREWTADGTHTSCATSSISAIRLPLTTVGRVCTSAAESDSSDIDLISELLPIKCQRMQLFGGW